MAPNHLYLRGGMTPEDLAGARVLRPCFISAAQRQRGDVLDEATVRGIGRANLLALFSQRFLAPIMRAEVAPASGKPFLRKRGVGTATCYDVIVGSLAGDGLTKEAAEALMAELEAPPAEPQAQVAA